MITSQFAPRSLRGTAFTRQGFTGSIPVLPTTFLSFQRFAHHPAVCGYDANPPQTAPHLNIERVGVTFSPYPRGPHV